MIIKTGKTDRNALQRLSGVAALAAVILLTAPPAPAQVNQTLHYDGWILAAAHAPGLEGSIWRTDLWFALDSAGSGPVTLRFCRSGNDNTGVLTGATYTVDTPALPEGFANDFALLFDAKGDYVTVAADSETNLNLYPKICLLESRCQGYLTKTLTFYTETCIIVLSKVGN